MQTIEQRKDEILSLFNDRMYTNPNGVILYLDSCDVVTLYLGYPDYSPVNPYTALSYWKEYPSIELFEKALSIKSRTSLDYLHSGFLQREFEKGEIDLSCYVENNGIGFNLFFRKQGAELFAHDNVNPEMRIVKRNKINPDILVAYTIEIATLRKVFSTSSQDNK